jgi:MFS family permease
MFVVAGLGLSMFVRDTTSHAMLESRADAPPGSDGRLRASQAPRDVLWRTTFADRNLSSATQVGLVNNLNDGLAWGLAPLFLAAHGASVSEIGFVAGLYPLVWGVGQLGTGALADRVNHKLLIVAGMLVQAAGLGVLAASDGRLGGAATAAALLGVGTALVYPTLMAAVSERTMPYERAPALGVYRFWRDSGYVVGALGTGAAADALGFQPAIALVAGLTAASGLWALIDMPSHSASVKTRPTGAGSLVPRGGN